MAVAEREEAPAMISPSYVVSFDLFVVGLSFFSHQLSLAIYPTIICSSPGLRFTRLLYAHFAG